MTKTRRNLIAVATGAILLSVLYLTLRDREADEVRREELAAPMESSRPETLVSEQAPDPWPVDTPSDAAAEQAITGMVTYYGGGDAAPGVMVRAWERCAIAAHVVCEGDCTSLQSLPRVPLGYTAERSQAMQCHREGGSGDE